MKTEAEIKQDLLVELIARYRHTLASTHGLYAADNQKFNDWYQIDNSIEIAAIDSVVDVSGVTVKPLEARI